MELNVLMAQERKVAEELLASKAQKEVEGLQES